MTGPRFEALTPDALAALLFPNGLPASPSPDQMITLTVADEERVREICREEITRVVTSITVEPPYSFTTTLTSPPAAEPATAPCVGDERPGAVEAVAAAAPAPGHPDDVVVPGIPATDLLRYSGITTDGSHFAGVAVAEQDPAKLMQYFYRHGVQSARVTRRGETVGEITQSPTGRTWWAEGAEGVGAS